METRVRLVFLAPDQLVVRKLTRGYGARHWLLTEEHDVSDQLPDLAQAFTPPAAPAVTFVAADDDDDDDDDDRE